MYLDKLLYRNVDISHAYLNGDDFAFNFKPFYVFFVTPVSGVRHYKEKTSQGRMCILEGVRMSIYWLLLGTFSTLLLKHCNKKQETEECILKLYGYIYQQGTYTPQAGN